MFILLPPSEAKAVDGGSPPLSLDSPLADARRTVLTEVASLCAKRPKIAASALKLPPTEIAEACRLNAGVLASPTMRALDRYTGVVYQGLSASTLSAGARAVAEQSILIFSGGLGVVGGDELVPWYRIPAAARLPRAGPVAALWRPVLASFLPTIIRDDFVVDLRSGDYAGMWRPPAGRVLAVRILQRRETGARTVDQVVSFHSKLAKGVLTRAIVQAVARRRRVDSPTAVSKIARELGLEVRAAPYGLDLIDTR